MIDYEESLYDYIIQRHKEDLKKIIKSQVNDFVKILERNDLARERMARIVKK